MSPKTNDRIKNLGTVSGCGLRALGRDTCDTSFFKENRKWFSSLRKRRVAGVAAHVQVVRLRPFSNGCVFCDAGPLLKRFRATWRQFLARGARTLPPQVGITPMSPGAFHSVCTKALPGLDKKKVHTLTCLRLTCTCCENPCVMTGAVQNHDVIVATCRWPFNATQRRE